MNGNLNSSVSGGRGISGEGWAAVVGVVGSAVLLLRKVLGGKGSKAEPVSREEFYTEALGTRERGHAMHLALLEKLEEMHSLNGRTALMTGDLGRARTSQGITTGRPYLVKPFDMAEAVNLIEKLGR